MEYIFMVVEYFKKQDEEEEENLVISRQKNSLEDFEPFDLQLTIFF